MANVVELVRRWDRRQHLIAGFTGVIAAVVAVVILGVVLGRGAQESTSPGAPAGETLRALAKARGLEVGTAVNGTHLRDDTYRDVLAQQFSMVTPENEMKWATVHPSADRYDFGPADAIVAAAAAQGQQVRGHTLTWYKSNPSWLDNGTFTKAELQQVLEDHIKTVVGHFKGKVAQWDVANEILDDDGSMRSSVWYDALGDDYLVDAFTWAHEADPDAKLYVNEQGLETSRTRTDAFFKEIDRLLAKGAPINGIGFEAHLTGAAKPNGPLREAMAAAASRGLDSAITELDVRMELGGNGSYDAEAQANVYRSVVDACLAQSRCRTLSFWGFTDGVSWVPGRYPNYGAATLMTDTFAPKKAFAVVQTALAAQ